MQINTNFDIGDTLYTYDFRRVMNKNCGFCGGVGKLSIIGVDGDTAMGKCPICNGTGNVQSKNSIAWSSKEEYYVRDKQAISMTKTKDNVTFEVAKIVYDERGVVYRCRAIDDGGMVIKEDAIIVPESKSFKTRESCQKWCDDKNILQQYS